MLSRYRTYDKPIKNEFYYIFIDMSSLIGVGLSAPLVLPFGIYSIFVHPVPKGYIAILVVGCFILAYQMMSIIKKRGYLIYLRDEANKMSVQEHKLRMRKLLPKIFMYYLFPLVMMVCILALTSYIQQNLPH